MSTPKSHGEAMIEYVKDYPGGAATVVAAMQQALGEIQELTEQDTADKIADWFDNCLKNCADGQIRRRADNEHMNIRDFTAAIRSGEWRT